MAYTISSDTSNTRQIDLQRQHLEASLDASGLIHLDTPSDRRKPTRVRGVSID